MFVIYVKLTMSFLFVASISLYKVNWRRRIEFAQGYIKEVLYGNVPDEILNVPHTLRVIFASYFLAM